MSARRRSSPPCTTLLADADDTPVVAVSSDASPQRLLPVVFSMAVTTAIAYGTLLFGFSVMMTDKAAGGDFSKAVLSAAYGLAVVVGGSLAFSVGRRVDHHGLAAVIGLGSVLGGVGFIVLATAREPWHVIVSGLFFMGPALAMASYEPIFVAIGHALPSVARPRALGIVTVGGGLAGPIYLPITAALVDAFGWRGAAGALGGFQAIVGLIVAFTIIPRGWGIGARSAERPQLMRWLAGDPRFVVYTLAIVLSSVAMQPVFVHRIAVFEDAGFSITLVAALGGLASIVSLPGRYVAPMMTGRFAGTSIQAGALLLAGLAVILMVYPRGTWPIVIHFVVFGAAFGALLPLRAVVMSHWYASAQLGRVMGLQWTLASLGGAGAVWLVGVARDELGTYRQTVIAMAGILMLSALLTTVSERVRARPIT